MLCVTINSDGKLLGAVILIVIVIFTVKVVIIFKVIAILV